MSMSVGSSEGEDQVLSEINTTPLVDIMLVLLIIFLVTSPLVLKLKKVSLPAETNKVYVTKPENITLVVTKEGDMYWNQLPIPDTTVLLEKLKGISEMNPQPELHIRGDQMTRYEFVGKVVLNAQKAGISKVAFITEPPARGE
jgi:biopolymer transport protein ExbD